MMRVGLMNLGDAPRVFHNRISRAVVVPVGRVVVADMFERDVQALKFPARPETVLVCDPETEVPEHMARVISLLNRAEFEEHHKVLTEFQAIAPPNNLGPGMRPSRMQIRELLRGMVEDYIFEAVRAETGDKPLIRDDKDPAVLEREYAEQTRTEAPEPHPLRQEKNEKVAATIANAVPVAPHRTKKSAKGKKR